MAEQSEAMFHTAVACYRGGAYDRARSICGALLDSFPDHVGVLGLLGAVELQRKDHHAAVAALAKATALAPMDPGILCNLGIAYRGAGQWGDARTCLEQVLQSHPGHEAARFNLALAERDGGAPEAALAQLQTVLDQNPQHNGAWLNRARIEAALQHHDAAHDAYYQLTLLEPASMEGHRGMAVMARRLGNYDAALAAFDKVIKINPDDGDAHAGRANILADLERFEDAAAAGVLGLKCNPNAASLWSVQAWILLQLGRLDDALAACRRAIEIDPDFTPARYHLGLIQQAVGDLPSAVQALEGAIAQNPRYVRALATLGLVHAGQGDNAAAGRIFDHDGMVGLHPITDVPGYDNITQFNLALTGHLHNHSSLMWNRPNRSTIDGSQTLDIAADQAGPVTALRGVIDHAVAAHLAAMGQRDKSGFYDHPPKDWDLVIWGVVLKSGGHQDPHNHPSGYLSGVYYLNVPDEVGQNGAEAGCLEFGLSNVMGRDGAFLAAGQRRVVRPEAGLMALFPSYFWHRTLPFQSQTERICVAFDVFSLET